MAKHQHSILASTLGFTLLAITCEDIVLRLTLEEADGIYLSFTAQTEANSSSSAGGTDENQLPASGTDLYGQLDKYFEEAAKELALGAPLDDVSLLRYIVPSFNRYHAGAQSANRLLNYVNRHYVKRAVDEDRGWFRVADLIELVAKDIPNEGSKDALSKIYREKKMEELKKWGYEEGDPDKAALAESCAEAASSPDRIVPVASLAHRRFRTDFIEHLLISPKAKGKSKAKNKMPKAPLGSQPARPKGRLPRAVHDLLESDTVEMEEKVLLATGLAKMLQLIGVRKDHVLRKKLDKFLASTLSKSDS
ncbi:hypothetical protein CVT26_002889 [Gymnopilus dilepis]|uniref:Uncharacterized protein n=1 Tax=Gymnopilus dilepis TaxID=231916 RepID=A0A409W2G0_9AGAR|nr:hypothetical protein CVT26_002889 [Gymnopilus dilepis]